MHISHSESYPLPEEELLSLDELLASLDELLASLDELLASLDELLALDELAAFDELLAPDELPLPLLTPLVLDAPRWALVLPTFGMPPPPVEASLPPDAPPALDDDSIPATGSAPMIWVQAPMLTPNKRQNHAALLT